jgi:O-antigen biosynthesis protein
LYCGEPPQAVCDACVAQNGSPFGILGVGLWRRRWRRLLSSARRVFVPDDDVGKRLARYIPGVPMTVRPHPESARLPRVSHRVRTSTSDHVPRRIGVIGQIGVHKGWKVLCACAQDVLERDLPLVFVVIGSTPDDIHARLLGMEVSGPFLENALAAFVSKAAIDMVFLPSVWPETYSFVLSQVLELGLYPVAFNLGAIANRIRTLRCGTLLPLDLAGNTSALNDELCAVQNLPVPPLSLRHYALSDYYEFTTAPCPAQRGLLDYSTDKRPLG